jgi:hypothetical protein
MDAERLHPTHLAAEEPIRTLRKLSFVGKRP